jgi:hypothetical protein
VRRMLLVLSVAALMGAMVLVMAVPAFATHFEGHRGGNTPEDKQCNTNGPDDTISCQGGGGGTIAGGGSGYPAGGGGHNTYDPATGDATVSGGGGGQRIAYDENGQEYVDPGGGGVHCEYNTVTGEYDCHGSPGSFS